MVDENETQQEVTPAIAWENVEAGVEQIESALVAVGPEGTEAQFHKAIGKVVPVGTAFGQSAFTQVRDSFHAGEGIGRAFLEHFLPCGQLRKDALSTILSSRYGKARAEAKQRQAARAESEGNTAEATRLRAEAKRIGEGAISEAVLLSFATTRQMSDFAAAVKANNVPKSHHKRLADHIQSEDLIGKQMARGVRDWWYDASGARKRDWEQTLRAEAVKRFRRYYRDGDLGLFLADLTEKARDLACAMDRCSDVARYHADQRQRDHWRGDLERLTAAARRLIDSLTGPAVRIDDAPAGRRGALLLNGGD